MTQLAPTIIQRDILQAQLAEMFSLIGDVHTIDRAYVLQRYFKMCLLKRTRNNTQNDTSPCTLSKCDINANPIKITQNVALIRE